MPRPRTDLARKIKDILGYVRPLPPEAGVPLRHYKRANTDTWATLEYVEKNFGQVSLSQAAATRHLGRLYAMALVNVVQAFERFLKEEAAACVDCLADFILDDRFNVFKVQGSGLAAHFGTATLGKSLCEATTWLDCEEINDRFRKVLADPFQAGGSFYLFPRQGQQPAVERWRFDTLTLVWQLRHTVVHNVGVITQSDAVKLRLWAKEAVASPRVLSPTRDDLRYVKRFLDETAERSNRRIGERLAELLTALHHETPILFVPQEMADRITQVFGLTLTVAGATGTLPPP